MGIASSYDDVTEDILDASAAWIPFVDQFEVGDFGKVSGGVFHRLGNLKKDFGIALPCHDGQSASIDFVSARTRTVRLEAGVEVPEFSAGSAEGKLVFEFEKKRSFAFKAATVRSVALDSIYKVAEQWFEHPQYSRKIRIVSRVYSAEDALLIAASERNTQVAISGKASLLKGADTGAIEAGAGLSIAANKELALKLVGAAGPIALDLFRVRIRGRVAMMEVPGAADSGADADFIVDESPPTGDDF